MSNKSPAFQYYPADMATDPEVMFWDMEQMGCYHAMLDYLWLNGGKFDGNSSDFLAKIAQIFRVSHRKRAQKLWEKISKKFEKTNGIISHKRTDKEMQRQAESRLRRQKAGKKGADKRWGPDSNAIFSGMAKNSPSSSTSTSSSTSVNNTHIQTPDENYTIDQVKNAAIMCGIPEKEAEEFYYHYSAQGWVLGNGQAIKDLTSMLVRWRNNQYKFKGEKNGKISKSGSSAGYSRVNADGFR